MESGAAASPCGSLGMPLEELIACLCAHGRVRGNLCNRTASSTARPELELSTALPGIGLSEDPVSGPGDQGGVYDWSRSYSVSAGLCVLFLAMCSIIIVLRILRHRDEPRQSRVTRVRPPVDSAPPPYEVVIQLPPPYSAHEPPPYSELDLAVKLPEATVVTLSAAGLVTTEVLPRSAEVSAGSGEVSPAAVVDPAAPRPQVTGPQSLWTRESAAPLRTGSRDPAAPPRTGSRDPAAPPRTGSCPRKC